MQHLNIQEAQIPKLDSTYRAVVIDAEEIEFAKGNTFLRLEYLIFDSKNSSTSLFTEEISCTANNPRGKEFFEFINENHVSLVDAEDLVGLVLTRVLLLKFFKTARILC